MLILSLARLNIEIYKIIKEAPLIKNANKMLSKRNRNQIRVSSEDRAFLEHAANSSANSTEMFLL